MGKLLCWLGIHKYRYRVAFICEGNDHITDHVCIRCQRNFSEEMIKYLKR